MNKNLKRIITFLVVNLFLFILTLIVLINWPIPIKENIKNYDYSSIDTTSVKTYKKEELWIEMRDRNKLFNRIYPSQSKTVLILIHGSGSESRYLKTLAGNLSENNIATVLTPDLRGHGRNLLDQPDIDHIGQLEEDIEEIIKYAKDSLGAKKIMLAGHSSGGGLVLRYLANPELIKVNKAIMIAPYLGHDAPTVRPNSGGWVTVGIKRWVGLSILNSLGIRMYNEMPVLFFNRPKAYDDKLQVNSYSYRMAINFAPKNYETDIINLKTKALVVVGEKDESFYTNKFKEVFNPSENYTKIELIKNANHLDIVKNKESINSIKNWILK